MKCVLLAGGLGTRLREETEHRPKPMVPVGGRPILWHIMKNYTAAGITDFVICLGYRGDVVREYFLNYRAMNTDTTVEVDTGRVTLHGDTEATRWSVTLAETGALTTTGGRVFRALPYTDGERFLCTYGDGLADVDIADVIRFHESHGQLATMTVVRPQSRFGVLDMNDDGRVNAFHEKPQATDYVNAGFFVFEPGFAKYLDAECILEQEPLRHAAADGELMAYRHDGWWQPMDTYREFTMLNELWDSGVAPWKRW